MMTIYDSFILPPGNKINECEQNALNYALTISQFEHKLTLVDLLVYLLGMFVLFL